MKYLITIVSLFISAEIQISLCSIINDGTTAIDIDESVPSLEPVDQEFYDNGQEHINQEVDEGEEDYESLVTPYFYTMETQDVASQPSGTSDGAEDNEEELSTSDSEMKRKAIANRDNAIRNAKSTFDSVKANIDTLRENTKKKQDEVLLKIYEPYRNAQLIAGVLRSRARKKFAEAKQRAEDNYNQVASGAEEKFEKVSKAYNAALEAADEEFEKERSQILENQRVIESQYQEVLEKARKEKDTALGLAKQKKDQAEKKYNKAIKGKRRLSSVERDRIDNEYLKELNKYDEAVVLAENKWQNVLDSIGIGRSSQYRVAEEQALKKHEEAEKQAQLIRDQAFDDREKILQEAMMNMHKANKLAEAEMLKAEKESKEIVNALEKQRDVTNRETQKEWEKIEAQTNEELDKALAEFSKAENVAIREYREALKTIREMEKNLANTENMIPEKVSQTNSSQGRSDTIRAGKTN